MRNISAQAITDTVARLCIEANTRLPPPAGAPGPPGRSPPLAGPETVISGIDEVSIDSMRSKLGKDIYFRNKNAASIREAASDYRRSSPVKFI